MRSRAKGGHVVGGVGESEDVVADEVGGGAVAEGANIFVKRDDRKLLEDIPREIVAGNLLTGDVVEGEAI